MSKQPWLYRLFWTGFHASTSIFCFMLAMLNATYVPFWVWFIFGIIMSVMCAHNYKIWFNAEHELEQMRKRRKG